MTAGKERIINHDRHLYFLQCLKERRALARF
jgi:hypothetical protein